ncbi:hypothetical protein JB92DRAFT_3129488 [Gautieria morchelliformis]|nr:hypothetical protein JB92DRAFT_3129488 [Gautieria morchelliformis]
MSSTNFYEVLGIDADASPEDIRRAYRKKALRTHPDRLPQGATAAEKDAANEQFRIVGTDFDCLAPMLADLSKVLMDSKNRKLYDLYGVWPPPDELPEVPKQQRGDRSGYPSHRPYPPSGVYDPFFNSSPFTHPFARHRPPAGFSFRDPFELFEAMFADMQRDFHHIPSPPLNASQFFNPYAHRPSFTFNHSHAQQSSLPPSLSPFMLTPNLSFFPANAFADDDDVHDHSQGGRPVPNAQSFSFQGSSRGQYGSGPNGQQPRWVSESTMTQSINGVTQTIHKKRDSLGNEHVTKIYPDGRQKYTVNGVEQSQSSGHVQDVSRGGRLPSANHDYDVAPPIIPPDPEEVHGASKKHWWGRH